MSYSSTIRGGIVFAGAALVGVFVAQSLVSSSFSAPSPIEFRHRDPVPPVTEIGSDLPSPGVPRRRDRHDGHAEEEGAVANGVTVFDDDIPAIAKLDPALLGALRRAATDAADDGVEVFVTSGWRSREYQEQLLREAVSKYGSEKEAARWVATADTSAHVSGDAVDIGPTEAIAWLSGHGAGYGLCQVYRNEPWHYELRPKAVQQQRCPPQYPDPTHDPRMQR
jgi:D-alanyl-D-alanine carboxypeptidase